MMKKSVYFWALLLLFAATSAVDGQEFGRIRALHHRGAHVIKQKNDFVAKVLTSYAVPYERNAQGVVVRISLDGQWQDVSSIEIVPVLKEGSGKEQKVTAHELFFFTKNGILNLFSDLAIR